MKEKHQAPGRVPIPSHASAQFGKYSIVRELGRGGMGTVYLAQDATLDRLVALKMLHESLGCAQGFVDRFRQEAKSVARLFHPNIVPINGFDFVEGRLVIEMPYVEGGSLERQMRTQGLFRSDLTRCVADVLKALDHCHGKAVVHRDVKPTNVLFDTDGRAMLADFGLAKLADERMALSLSSPTSHGVFVGTPRYAPPEAWEGGEPTPAWDLYSVGVMLYEGVTGEPLYSAQTPLAYLKELGERTIVPLAERQPGASSELSCVVARLLKKDIGERSGSAAEVLEELKRVPEYACEEEDRKPTTRIRVTFPASPRSSLLEKTKRVGKRAMPWSGWAALLIVLLALIPWLGAQRGAEGGGAPVSAASAGPLAQSALPTSLVPTTEDLLSRARFEAPEAGTVYRSDAPGDGEAPTYWLLRSRGNDQTVSALARSQHRILSVTLLGQMGEEGLIVSGRWGGYTDEGATTCWHGAASGQGKWLEPGRVLAFSLDFASVSQAVHFAESVVLMREEQTDTAFLYALEEDELLMPLLCNELVPRDDRWRAVLSEWLPAVAGARTKAAMLDASEGNVQVDGRADEATWSRAGFLEAEAPARGWPRQASPELGVRQGADALYLLLTGTGIAINHPVVEIALLTEYRVPVDASPTWYAAFRDGAIQAGRHVRAGQTVRWLPDWQCSQGMDGQRWTCEVRIPYAGLGFEGMPSGSASWRLNVHVSESREDGPGDVVLAWGAPEVQDVLHGLMVTLDEGQEEGP